MTDVHLLSDVRGRHVDDDPLLDFHFRGKRPDLYDLRDEVRDKFLLQEDVYETRICWRKLEMKSGDD